MKINNKINSFYLFNHIKMIEKIDKILDSLSLPKDILTLKRINKNFYEFLFNFITTRLEDFEKLLLLENFIRKELPIANYWKKQVEYESIKNEEEILKKAKQRPEILKNTDFYNNLKNYLYIAEIRKKAYELWLKKILDYEFYIYLDKIRELRSIKEEKEELNEEQLEYLKLIHKNLKNLINMIRELLIYPVLLDLKNNPNYWDFYNHLEKRINKINDLILKISKQTKQQEERILDFFSKITIKYEELKDKKNEDLFILTWLEKIKVNLYLKENWKRKEITKFNISEIIKINKNYIEKNFKNLFTNLLLLKEFIYNYQNDNFEKLKELWLLNEIRWKDNVLISKIFHK